MLSQSYLQWMLLSQLNFGVNLEPSSVMSQSYLQWMLLSQASGLSYIIRS